jgi:hypothetical protein
MSLAKALVTATDVPCSVACPISTLSGHRHEVKLTTKHGCAPGLKVRALLVIARQDVGNTTTTCKASASAQWHVQEPQPQEPPPSPPDGPNGATRSPIFEPKRENFFSSSSEPQFVHSTSTVLVITNFSKSRLQTRQ